MKQRVYSTLAMKAGSCGETGGASQLAPPRGPRRGPPNGGTGTPGPIQLLAALQPPPLHAAALLWPTHHREVGLLHLLQQHAQRRQVQHDVVGFLQPCMDQGQGAGHAQVSQQPRPSGPLTGQK